MHVPAFAAASPAARPPLLLLLVAIISLLLLLLQALCLAVALSLLLVAMFLLLVAMPRCCMAVAMPLPPSLLQALGRRMDARDLYRWAAEVRLLPGQVEIPTEQDLASYQHANGMVGLGAESCAVAGASWDVDRMMGLGGVEARGL